MRKKAAASTFVKVVAIWIVMVRAEYETISGEAGRSPRYRQMHNWSVFILAGLMSFRFSSELALREKFAMGDWEGCALG